MPSKPHRPDRLTDRALSLRKRIGELVRTERLRRNMTQKDLGKTAGVSRPTVIAVESGRSVSSQNLLILMASLDVSFIDQDRAASNRPRLKELMRAERERHVTLQRKRSAGLRTVGQAAAVSDGKGQTPSVPEHRPDRPLLKDLLVSERERQTRLIGRHGL